MPLVKLKKYWKYLEKLGTIINDEEDLKGLKYEVKYELKKHEDLNEEKSWELENVFNKFSELDLTEQSSNLLGKIWRSAHTTTFDGCLYDEVFIVIDNYKKHLKIPQHLDVRNPKFDVDDLKKLIKSTTEDLEKADRERRDDFKRYEMEKKFEEEERLKHIEDEAKRY